MKLDNYVCDNQISMFDYLDKPKEKSIDDYLEEAIMHGTGFVNGKKRVYELYQNEISSTERAKLIKKEYGIGGAGWPLNGYGLHGYDSFNNGGLKIQYRDADGEHVHIISWNKVEEIIRRLVCDGKYYTPK